ncbi:class I glutamine amidotransferase-like protein [Dichomitus squalens]|uniref:Class I glutamine amidotransferase-like protein n=1 Tax=Dichomitus squalens TaxID=114155 RepID=A0A4Q9PN23_9APHY|nr:class I glutamine amidotransferase-like protein [Dichomitus squalens]
MPSTPSLHTVLLSSLIFLAAQPIMAQQTNAARVLIYSATADFRHDSIPTAVDALVQHGPGTDISFDHTEDKTWFTDDTLAQYDAVLFLMNTGEVLDDSGKTALRKYLDFGGNFVAIHAASDALRNTTWYQNEVGAAFDYHPALTNAIVDVTGPPHPSTAGLPQEWSVQDEMYNFKSDPRAIGAVVILSANESSYTDPGPRKFDQGTPHPTAWFQEHGAGIDSNGTAGRSFYTSLGHLNETWQDSLFMGHVMGGITWTLQSNTTRAFNATASVGNGPSGSNSTSITSGSATGTSSHTSPSSTDTSPNSSASLATPAGIILLGLGIFASCLWTMFI